MSVASALLILLLISRSLQCYQRLFLLSPASHHSFNTLQSGVWSQFICLFSCTCPFLSLSPAHTCLILCLECLQYFSCRLQTLASFFLQGINPNEHPQSASYYLKVYLALSLFVMAANVLRDVVAVWGSYRASKSMHERLLSHVVALPMTFFDSQPMGRLLNRFTKDTEAIDEELLQLVSHHSSTLHRRAQLSAGLCSCVCMYCLQASVDYEDLDTGCWAWH